MYVVVTHQEDMHSALRNLVGDDDQLPEIRNI